jgi:ABC-2 type transport system ATP-binding protein
MQRRLNLACALVHRPVLLLLDEPTAGVDVAARDAIFDSLRELRARGCALVFTTHHLHEVEQLCDRIGLMNRGRLVAEGTLDELDSAAAVLTPSSSARPRLERVYLAMTASQEGRR